MRPQLIAALVLAASLTGCLATKVVTVPVSLAGDVIEGAGKGVLLVGGTAVRTTVDLVDGPDQRVELTAKVKKGSRTRTIRKEIDSRDLERELEKIGKKGQTVDVSVEPVD
jgi:Flp pilus assembly CpaE family ATPase